MSCSHAVDVDRSKAHFSSMCCWTLRQNVQDVFWLPRIPDDIIIPSLSFLSSPPQLLFAPSPSLGLYVPLYVKYRLYSIASHLFWFRSSCWGLPRENSALANTLILFSRQITSRERVTPAFFFNLLQMDPIYAWFGEEGATNIFSGFCTISYRRYPAIFIMDSWPISFQHYFKVICRTFFPIIP